MEFEKVKESEEGQFTLEDIGKPVAVVGLDGSVCKVNDQFTNVFGSEEKNNIDEIIGVESLNRWRNYLVDVQKKIRMTVKVQISLNRYQMYMIKVSLFFCPIEEKVMILFNMPPSLKKVRGKYSSIAFRKSDNLMIIANIDGVVEDVNDLTIDFFNLPRDYFIGLKIEEVFGLFSGEQSYLDDFKESIMAEGQGEMIQQYIYSSDDIRYYKIASFFDKDCNSFLTRITDYTEKEMLQRILEEKDSLSEVGQLAASIAHEIRNPMTTLKGFTQLLKSTATEETLKYLTVIDEEILRMEAILSEMLFLSKPNVKEKTRVSAKKLLLDIISVIYPKATIEGIAIVRKGDFETETSIYGDEGKLKQVLLNLLKNALESMCPGGTLTITLEDGTDGQLKLMIEDTGKGMDATQLNQIFSPYFTTRPNGTGLGLPFVLKTIEEHNGTIAVSSKINIGSKFIISFPQVTLVKEEEGVLKESVLVN